MRVVIDVKNGDEFVTARVPSLRWAAYKLGCIRVRLCGAIRSVWGGAWQDQGKK